MPGPATQLLWGVQPTTTVSGADITPAVTVLVADADGVTVTTSTASVSVTLWRATDPVDALYGTTTVDAVAGVATFAELHVSIPHAAYSLRATSGSLAAVSSASFAITAPPDGIDGPAPLQPFLRIINLVTNSQLATTVALLDWSFSSTIDKPGDFSISISAGDPGSAGEGGLAAAAALLRAGADLTTGADPLPLLLELSLDNGYSVDSKRLARNPRRTLTATRRTVTEAGADLGETLGLVPVLRAAYNNVTANDCLNAAPGTIVPVTDLGISYGIRAPTDPLPHLAGVLHNTPVLTSWASGAQARLAFTAALHPDIGASPLTLDVDSVTVLAIIQQVAQRLAGVGETQALGHWVCDPSSVLWNLSGAVDWIPSPIATSPCIIIGHQGATPWVTFDATGDPGTNEDTTAVVYDSSTLGSDDTGLYQAAVMQGAKSQHGVPDDARLVAMVCLRPTTPEMSSGRDDWRDGLLLVGAAWNNVEGRDLSGGVFYLLADNVLRPVPGSPARACHALAYDAATDGGRVPGLLMGTTSGVFYSTDDPSTWTDATAWTKLDGLDDDVVGLALEHDPSHASYPVIFAQTRGRKESSDSIWRWAYQGDTPSWCWKPVISNQRLTGFSTTDYQTVWLALERPGDHLYQWFIGSTGWTHQTGDFTLPHGGQIRRVQRVITVDPADSIWVLLDGDQTVRDIPDGVFPSPAYYLLNSGGTWGPSFKNANMDGTLVGPPPELPVVSVHKAFGGGITFDPTTVPGSGTTVNAMLGTSTGALWTDQPLTTTSGFNWRRVSMGGLDAFSIDNIIAPEATVLLGRTINKLYMISNNDLLISQSSGRWFKPLKGYDRTDVGPYLSQVCFSQNDAQGSGTGHTWMHSRIQTVGTTNANGTAMTTSPIGGASTTHIHVPHTSEDFIPRGMYWRRNFDDQQNLTYTLESQSAHLPGTQLAVLPDLQSGAPSVTARSAAQAVSIVARRFLLQRHTPVITLSIESSFSTQTAALRSLRATMKAAVVGDVTITDISSGGVAVSTGVLTFDGSEDLWVLSHTIKKGPGATAQTTTVLSNVLANQQITPEELGAAVLDQVHTSRVWGR